MICRERNWGSRLVQQLILSAVLRLNRYLIKLRKRNSRMFLKFKFSVTERNALVIVNCWFDDDFFQLNLFPSYVWCPRMSKRFLILQSRLFSNLQGGRRWPGRRGAEAQGAQLCKFPWLPFIGKVFILLKIYFCPLLNKTYMGNYLPARIWQSPQPPAERVLPHGFFC